MSTTGHAATVRVLNTAAKQAAEAAINASSRGDQPQAWQHSIDLLREHMRHQPDTADGRVRHDRAARNIRILRAYIAQARREEKAT